MAVCVHLLVFCIVGLTGLHTQSRVTVDCRIVQKPLDTVGYVGGTATFNCTIDSNYRLNWFLTGNYTISNRLADPPYSVITERQSQRDDPTTLTSIMTVRASTATNNTIVFCTAFFYPDIVMFSNATLLVQGQLAAPSNLTVTEIDSAFNVAFEKPYCLPGADIINYGFVIDVPSQNVTVNTTFNDTHFQFVLSDYNISRCEDQYIVFSVCAVNPAGEGGFSSTAVFVSAASRHCDLTTSPQLHPTKCRGDNTILILVLMVTSLATFVLLVTIICSVVLQRMRLKNRTTPSEESKEVCPTTLNDAYAGTYPMVKNEAYSSLGVKEPPHMYDTVHDPVGLDPVYETIGESKGKKNYDIYQDA